MKLRLPRGGRSIIAISMVRDEEDIIERFARHCLSWADGLLIVDHSSTDNTSRILQSLIDEGLCLQVLRDEALGKHQADRLTLLATSAASQLSAYLIVPLDADEFMIAGDGADIRARLQSLPSDAVTFASWRNYVPTPADDENECDILRRITHRVKAPSDITKAIIGAQVALTDGFRLAHGSHWVFAGGLRVAATAGPCQFYIGHFPVRSAGQITAKMLINPLTGMLDLERFPTAQEHYRDMRERGPVHSYMSFAELQRLAENYAIRPPVDSPGLVFDPINDRSGPLRYTKASRVDAARRLEQFARVLIRKIGVDADSGDGPVAIRKLISTENDNLRMHIALLERQNLELRNLRGFKLVWLIHRVLKVLKRIRGRMTSMMSRKGESRLR